MKYLARKILTVVLVMTTISSLVIPAIAVGNHTMKLTATPKDGTVTVSRTKDTVFAVEPVITDAKGADVTDEYTFAFSWMLNGTTVSTDSYYAMSKKTELTDDSFLLCTVTAKHKEDFSVLREYVYWFPTDDLVKDIELTISDRTTYFYFDSTDTQTGVSVFSEICDALELTSADDLSKYQVTFLGDLSSVGYLEGISMCKLNELGKLGLHVMSAGKWSSEYYVKLNGVDVLKGKLTITVEKRVGGDAFYLADPGDTVVINAEDFIKFWEENAADTAKLDFIYIVNCFGTSGVLCYDHSYSEKQHTVANGMSLYLDSNSSLKKPLADLTFVPTKMSNQYPEGTVTLNFVANGRDKNNNPLVIPGSIMIFYTKTSVTNITYECNGSHAMLKTDDFNDVYREMTKSNAKTPVYSVRFLDLPQYGTLYCGFDKNGYGSNNGVALTQNNLATMSFTSVSTANNSLDKLAYIPYSSSAIGDTVRYMVYADNKVLYIGTVTFRSKEIVVTYTTTVNTPVQFTSADFFTAGSPLLNAPYLVFGNTYNGTLYKDYANNVRVQTHEYYSYTSGYGINLLDTITFVPNADYTGLVNIMFSGTALTGGTVTGKVRIYVVRNDNFEDVASDNWAAPYINRLYATGVISGTSATTFSPDKNMTYGEALKMILLAAGCPKQSETGGTHWASKYLDYAYRNGFVSSNNIDLDAPINRDAVAELAAKVLGMGIATSLNLGVIGPVDSTNGYVWALYNAGILNGSFDAEGYNRYYGSQPITRAQVAKIICKINDYVG